MPWLVIVVVCLFAGPVPAQDFTTLKGHGGPIMDLAVTPRGTVLSASFDNSVGVWHAGTPTWLDGHTAAVTVVIPSPHGAISGSDDFTVRVWGDQPRVLGRHQGKVTALALHPDGRHLASGSWDGTLRVWSLDTGASVLLNRPRAGVNTLSYDAAGRLYAGTAGGDLLMYATTDADPLPLVKHGFGINEVIAGPGWVAYGAVDGGTRVVDAHTGAQITDVTLERRPILSMAWHPGSNQLAVGDGHGYIMMLDTATWGITRDFRATHHGPVWALAFSPDGTVIHAGGLDDVIYAWPVSLLDTFDPAIDGQRGFLRDAASMPNGERQFMRKCSICHALDPGPSRKAGPTLADVFGRPAGSLTDYSYSDTLDGSAIVWTETTINDLFEIGPDHYIPGSKMPMQVIRGTQDRADLIDFLKTATKE